MNIVKSSFRRRSIVAAVAVLIGLLSASNTFASSEASLVLPDLKCGSFLGMTGHTLLMLGILLARLVYMTELPLESWWFSIEFLSWHDPLRASDMPKASLSRVG